MQGGGTHHFMKERIFKPHIGELQPLLSLMDRTTCLICLYILHMLSCKSHKLRHTWSFDWKETAVKGIWKSWQTIYPDLYPEYQPSISIYSYFKQGCLLVDQNICYVVSPNKHPEVGDQAVSYLIPCRDQQKSPYTLSEGLAHKLWSYGHYLVNKILTLSAYPHD